MPEHTLTVGEVRVTALVDMAIQRFPWAMDRILPTTPPEDLAVFRERYPEVFDGEDGWTMDVSCYLLQAGERTILVDTGGGPASTGFAKWCDAAGRLPQELDAVGVAVTDVEQVLLTHLHWDHVGWNVTERKGALQLMFPAARYLVHEADWETFQKPEVQAAAPFPFVEELVTPLQRLGGLELFDGSEHTVTPEISLLHTPGHTPGSASILVDSGGERAIIWGDTIVHPALITHPEWEFGFDMEPEQAKRTRERLVEMVESQGMTAVACHMPAPGYGTIVRVEGKRWWRGA
jgi:glyoxylase-like metal-dependent hydrolase (beta-lactamase superfamily II)